VAETATGRQTETGIAIAIARRIEIDTGIGRQVGRRRCTGISYTIRYELRREEKGTYADWDWEAEAGWEAGADMLLEKADADELELELEAADTEALELDDALEATEPSVTPSSKRTPAICTCALTATASLSTATSVMSASTRGASASTGRRGLTSRLDASMSI
jgi:hypothetical protein